MSSSESKGTVLLALTANGVIAILKFGAGIIGGSAALLSEGAHSIADTLNQVFLLASLKQSQRPADRTHPFGYGMNRFFWSLLAAVGIFVTGGMFSLFEGINRLRHPPGHEAGGYWISIGVLAFAFLFEGASFLKATTQLRGEAKEKGRSFLEHLRRSNDPTVKTVFSEDSAALAGLVIAAVGITLARITGNELWDALAAMVIGVLLICVAYVLGNDVKSLLIGEAADPDLRRELWRELRSYDEVDEVVEVLTMLLGPESVLVAARIDLRKGLSSDEVEAVSTRISDELTQHYPEVKQVFLDATYASQEDRDRASGMARELGV